MTAAKHVIWWNIRAKVTFVRVWHVAQKRQEGGVTHAVIIVATAVGKGVIDKDCSDRLAIDLTAILRSLGACRNGIGNQVGGQFRELTAITASAAATTAIAPFFFAAFSRGISNIFKTFLISIELAATSHFSQSAIGSEKENGTNDKEDFHCDVKVAAKKEKDDSQAFQTQK